ncbi:MAG: hypothetical protein WC825_05930 [Gallionellaceae bacterium]|jgi:hypothetical protein
MKNLLIIGLMVSILGGCASRGEVKPSVSTFDPTDLSHFSYLAQLEEDSLDTEQYAGTAYVETVADAQGTVAEANDNSQKTSASFFTWNENLEQSELN